ncbi:PRK06851 family protein [Bacillus massiliglaciei]|uniref:PRK06851 family protein n=1 Tax=Bacillus massiliglaciei TaxID=1816693 RepID=UPI000AB45877|nr:PRK06851 family protein [Bacillus massiliglaciei]
MTGKALHYFAGGNTARGYCSLYESNFTGLEKLFILKGGPGTGKSTLMEKSAKSWQAKGYDVEYLHSSLDSDSIEGFVIPALKAGIVDGTEPHVIEPKAPGAVEEYVNAGSAWDSAMLAAERASILRLKNTRSKAFDTAYACFKEALEIHDEWEKIYLANIEFSKLNALTDKLIDSFFGEIYLNKQAEVKHRFLGSATPSGAVDFVPNLTETVKRRYFLKGRPGSGKSTMLKKIAKEAEKRGFDTEMYHCGFDPNSLDMVIVREIGAAIFDSTAPHEYFPVREGDEIIDIYSQAILPGTDEIYAEQIKDVSGRYKSKMTEATDFLSKAKEAHDQLAAIYTEATDFSVIENLQTEMDKTFEKLSKKRQEKI